METITREEFDQLTEESDDLVVVDVLSPDSYKEYHIPGAINVPVGENFDENIRQAVPDKDTPVVVYCLDEQCLASEKAGKIMQRLGYARVYDYAAGKEDWREANRRLVAGSAPG